jgi:hypothetical protein
MVGGFDIATNGVFEFAGRAMAAPANLLFGQSREPALHQIESGSAGGREVHVKARMADQPAMNQRRFGCRVVVQDQVHVQSGGHRRVDAVQEFPKLDRPVARMEITQIRALPIVLTRADSMRVVREFDLKGEGP